MTSTNANPRTAPTATGLGRTTTRRAAIGAGGTLAGMLAAACGSARTRVGGIPNERSVPNGGKPIKVEAGTLQWMLWGTQPDRVALYQEIATRFQSEQDAVKLEPLVPAGDGSYFDKLKTQLAGGQQVDVIGASPVWVPDVATTGLGRELDEFLARDKSFKIDDYAKGVVDAGSWKSKLYFLTLFGNFNVLYYNKTLFDRSGIKYPDASWTADTVLNAAKQMSQQTGNPDMDVYGFNFARDLNNVSPWLWQNGGAAFDKREDPTKGTMSSPATLEAFTWLVDLINKYRVAPGANGAKAPNFTTGRVAMVTQGVNSIGRVTTDAEFPWDIAIHPKGSKGRPNYAGTLFYGLAAATTLPDAAWTFLKYLCGPSGQRLFVNEQIGAPVHKSLMAEYEQLPPPPDNRKAVIDTLPHLMALPKTQKMMEIYAPVFTTTMAAAFAGTISATEACRKIDEQVAAILGS